MISSMEDEHVVKSFADIQPGILLTGFVRNIMSYGVFVEFPYGLTGLAPKSVRLVSVFIIMIALFRCIC